MFSSDMACRTPRRGATEASCKRDCSGSGVGTMAGRGLSTADLDQIRQVLAGGKRPRVMFTDAAGQIAGQIGQVVALEDPKSSDEWIVVKFGGDALPFSPADLTLPPRGGAPAKKAALKAAEPEKAPSGRKPLAIGEDL